MKKIKSYDGACKVLNLDSTLPDFPMLSEKERKAMQAHYKLVIIAKALNGNWKPDWSRWSEYKYFPWFGFQVSRFVFGGVNYSGMVSCHGSRLCYKDRTTAKYAGKTFVNLYNDYFQLE